MRRLLLVAAWALLLLFVLSSCAQAEERGPSELAQGTPTAPGALATLSTAITSSATPETSATASPVSTITPTTASPTSASVMATATRAASATPTTFAEPEQEFDGELAFQQLEAQMAFGPRWPGSPGHEAVGDYIVSELEALGWKVEEQLFTYMGVQGRNVIGRANLDRGDVTIIGAHYDTRRVADQPPGAVEERLPVPGAVDGASGVAVLLELARTLDLDEVDGEVWLAFFDMEDNGGGGLPGWDWIVGSTYMAENLTVTPDAMVLVDLVGDADQQLYFEGNSDPDLRATIWAIAADLGYDDVFIPTVKYTMIDDHVPFARKGIPAIDIIDFDYPYWHTVEDTTDKASATSLERVGRTIEVWLETEME